MKCYHHNDLDGRCAAAIVVKAHGTHVELIEMDYKKETFNHTRKFRGRI